MDFAEQVKQQVDIVNVVGEYVRLRKASANRFTGLCPFHNEKTASFSVNAAHQYYYCFGCHAKGDMFNFVMQIEGLTFWEALKSVAERHGIPVPARREQHDPQSSLRDAIQRMHEIAAVHFQTNLNGASGKEARDYILRRGFDASIAQKFGLGYSERSGNPLLRILQREGFSPEALEQSSLVFKRDDGSFYDRFRGRLMFPIHDESGRVIAFGGRAMAEGDEPKYLNSSTTPIYEKKNVLYNLYRAKPAIRQHERIILVEGYMDVIGLAAGGWTEAVAPCGTALTDQQVRVMKRSSDKVVVNFDGDNAGKQAAEKAIDVLLGEGMRLRVLELPNGQDPDEFIKQNGAEAYERLLGKAPGYFLWLADRARRKFDMSTIEGRMEGFKWLLPAIQRITDKLERAAVADEIASYLHVEKGIVLEEFRKNSRTNPVNRSAAQPAPWPRAERVLVRSLLSSAEAREAIVPRLEEFTVVRRFLCAPVIQAICVLYGSNPNFEYAELESQLADRERRLLADAVFADDVEEAVFTAEQARSYLQVLDREERQAQLGELRNQLKEAERSGNLELAMRLLNEISRLQRAVFS